MRKALNLALTLLLLVNPYCFADNFEPINFFLTWMRAPSETMTIRWISKDDRASDTIEFREKGSNEWLARSGSHIKMPYRLAYFIHNLELTSLKPDTCYEFRFSDEGSIYFFCTMPDRLTRPIRFADGGDMYHDEIFYLKETMQQAALTNPDFVVAGGDLAYSSPSVGIFHEDYKRWFTFLSIWQETMRAPSGRIIPMVPLIGNHEVIGRYNETEKEAEFYYALFVTPRSSTNYVLDFGNYMSLLLLDSGHTQSVEGKQAEWIEKILNERKNVPNKFASYHVPAYPSVRKYENKVSAKIRQNWVPVFESGGLNAAFEHHDHAYKRTYPLFQGKIDEERGIIYLGDGAFGVREARMAKDSSRWYLQKAIPARHFIFITLEDGTRTYQAIDQKGKVIDKLVR